MSVAALDSDLASYERVRSLFEFQPAEGDALLAKLTTFTTSYRTYAADYEQVQSLLSKTEHFDLAAATAGKLGSIGAEGSFLNRAVTLEGLQAHTMSNK